MDNSESINSQYVGGMANRCALVDLPDKAAGDGIAVLPDAAKVILSRKRNKKDKSEKKR